MLSEGATPSPRSREAVLVLTQWALLAPLAFLPRGLLVAAAAMATASAVVAWRWRLARPLLVGSVVALVCLGWLVRLPSQLTFGLALGLCALGLRLLRSDPKRSSVTGQTPGASWRGFADATALWWRRGRVDPIVWLWTLASVAVSAAALLCWFRLWHPNVDDIRRSFMPEWPTWLLLSGGVLFALLNAAVEELVYRGVLQHALAGATGSRAAALVLQAVAFGLLHIHGFPRGWAGVGLATIYGLMMGGLRLWVGGLLAPWLGHVLTDVSIVVIMLFWTRT